jgi:hypothetical protein
MEWIHLNQDKDQWYGNEYSGSVKCWKILEQLIEDLAPWSYLYVT